MPVFQILNRSPDGSTYFSQEGMVNWASLPIVGMVERNGTVINGQFVPQMDYLTMQMTAVPGFPQLFFRVYGNFTFITDITSNGTNGKYVAAGSVINTIEVIDASGNAFNRLSGINYAIPSDLTTITIEPANVFATSFRELELITSNASVPAFMSGTDSASGTSGAEVLQGFGGNDTVSGFGGADELWGDDRQGLSTGNDVLFGGGGTDTLIGGTGHDVLDGGADADILYGGAGNDRFRDYTAGDQIYGGENIDTWDIIGFTTSGPSLQPNVNLSAVNFFDIEVLRIFGGTILLNSNQLGNSTVIRIEGGTDGRDSVLVQMVTTSVNFGGTDFVNWNNVSGFFDLFQINGTNQSDLIVGARVNDRIFANDGNNTVFGGAGADFISAGGDNDRLNGGAGSDILMGWGGNDTLVGDDSGSNRLDDGSDSIVGDSGDDVIFGFQGFNIIDGGSGSDWVNYRFTPYTPGGERTYLYVDLETPVDPNDPETAFSAYGDVDYTEVFIPYLRDVLIGIENIQGSEAQDVIRGNAQANILNGWGGNDTLDGRAGDDTLNGGTGADLLIGGTGINTLSYTGSAQGVTVRLGPLTAAGGDAAGDRLQGAFAHLLGSGQGDDLGGTSFDNRISAGAGNDTLLGYSGNDTLIASTGDDRLVAGAGSDTLFGGTGADRFVFASGHALDRVMDFENGLDLVDLSGLTFAQFTETAITGGVRLTAAGGLVLELMGVTTAQITATDFI
jgi:Ca2+-binding RTX toxin-like protein